MNETSVSVIIPCFNGELYLHNAIESIRKQTMPVDEILIIDDGSTLPVSELKTFDLQDIKIIRKHNQGQGSAINTGIKNAQGKLLAFLDHDDIWDPDKNRIQQQLLLENKLDVVVGQVINERIQSNGIVRSQKMGSARLFGSSMFTRGAFSKIGPVAEDGKIHEVIDWWSRAANTLQIGFSNHVDLIRRIHGGNMTIQENPNERIDLLTRVRENLQRNHLNL